MQLVDKYVRTAKECREEARKARSAAVKAQFAKAAEVWDLLAKERLRLLQLRTDVLGPPGDTTP